MVSRRSLLAFSAAALLAGTGKSPAALAQRTSARPEIGLNLISWDTATNANTSAWRAAVANISTQGFRHVTLVPYWFVDPDSGEVREESHNRHDPGASFEALAAAITTARALKTQVAVKPIVEVDQPGSLAEVWRGEVRLSGEACDRFFSTYSRLVVKLAELAAANGATRLYIGSELAGLTADSTTQPYWTRLIASARAAFPPRAGQISYAANYDEYENVPFWGQLDEIGVDAYFPLATEEEAAGVGQPSKATMARHWRGHLAMLKQFSAKYGKPIRFAEFGIVPRDLSSLSPWDWRGPERDRTRVADPEEQLNAIAALLDSIGEHSDWLTGIDFWHWEMPGSEDSLYSIRRDSAAARLLADFARGT